jgi:opacity protein-like surface antigen
MQFLPLFCRSLVFLALQFFLLLISASALHAQATPTASKPVAASVFGAYSLVFTDRKINLNTPAATNSESTINSGFTFGADISANLPHGFIPSLEGRIKLAPGSFVSENTYGGGVRLEHRFQYFHPYIDFLMSYGTISFKQLHSSYPDDNSIVYSPGGGLDYNITPNWATRVDYQYEFWNTGNNVSFNPNALTIGVVYRIPFRSYQSR